MSSWFEKSDESRLQSDHFDYGITISRNNIDDPTSVREGTLNVPASELLKDLQPIRDQGMSDPYAFLKWHTRAVPSQSVVPVIYEEYDEDGFVGMRLIQHRTALPRNNWIYRQTVFRLHPKALEFLSNLSSNSRQNRKRRKL
jgi:hypothetical protein